MADTPNDPREPLPDPIAALRAELDQDMAMHLQFTDDLAKVMAAEWHALRKEEVPPLAAAIIIGTRFQMGG